MRDQHDLWSAIRARQRSRSVVRAVTIGAGMAGIGTAGLIAWNLPAPVHTQQAVTSTQPSAQPSRQHDDRSLSGDDSDEGARAPAPVPAQPQAPAQVTTGGS